MKRENPSTFRLTADQLDRINRRAAETGFPRNRILRFAIDAYFRSDLDAA